jgi:hypothetical protein
MYDSVQAFLMEAGECDLACSGDRVEEGWRTVGPNGTKWPIPDNANTAVPPPSTPVIADLLNVKLQPRKSNIDPSSLASFHPGPLVVASPSHHLFETAGCCISC